MMHIMHHVCFVLKTPDKLPANMCNAITPTLQHITLSKQHVTKQYTTTTTTTTI